MLFCVCVCVCVCVSMAFVQCNKGSKCFGVMMGKVSSGTFDRANRLCDIQSMRAQVESDRWCDIWLFVYY